MMLSFFYVVCLWTGGIFLTIALDSELQKQCQVFWTRIKHTPFWLKCWHMSFFMTVMLPTRVFCLQPWILHVAAPGTFCVVFALSYPVVAICFFMWIGLLMENIMLGVLYHKSVLGKKYIDTVALGPDMVLYFLGNTGSIPFALSKHALRGSVAASGAVLAEKALIDAYTYGETYLEEIKHIEKGGEYDFNKNWNMKKNSSYDKAIFQNLVSYIRNK